ncbi:Mitochondrial import inner membrane translocase subunit tim50 [Zalerion maritima]|uniref:Mitochondrial import inner membrane translocase subunit TIM50 n=1 Tax=Zalerion maritima TaxID=339359 RepID=A0AAD5RMB4_9PEZI|nr:Mitochondrial import inner membrane translocase subunit tim50 [Zalerion maritima]
MLSRTALRFSARAAISAQAAAFARPTPLARTGATSSIVWTRQLSKKNRNRDYNQWQSSGVESSRSSAEKPSQKNPAGQTSETGFPSTQNTTRSNIQQESWTQQKPSPSEQGKSSEVEPDEKEIPLDQLPDLTQGIPSTLEYEHDGKDPNALATTEQPEAGGGGRRRGELPDSAYVSSSERKRLKLAKFMYLSMLATGVISIGFLGRDWETEAEMRKYPEAPNGVSPGLWWQRAKIRSTDWLTYYQEPSFDKLLPDPEPSFERPYTLVLSLEDLLIHSEWTREHGWRVAKRPGVDYFLRYLTQYYELVLFTSVSFAMAEPIVRKLDPYHLIMFPLFREATKYTDGEVLKDLSYLNRPLSKVIILDTNASHVRAQPENAIVLPKWTGDPNDNELVALIPFLEYIHTMQFNDVRRIIKSFQGKHIPTEFARREAIARREFEKELAEKRKGFHHDKAPSGLSFLGNLLGLKPSSMSMMPQMEGEEHPQEAFAKGKMLQDIARERGQRNYEMLEQQIRENGEKWLKEEAEMMEKAQKEAMSSMKSNFSSWFTGGKKD